MTERVLRLVLAEDHFLVREGTRRLLESSGRINVVASVADKEALMTAVRTLIPDAVIADIRMPPTHQTEGIDAALVIRRAFPDTGVVILSQYVNALYAFQLFANGTEGLAYLLKDRVGDLDQLLNAVTAVTNHGSVIDPLVVEGLLARGDVAQRPQLAELTEREREVLSEMAQGKSNAAIAESLYISESAVEKHVSAVFMKLSLAATGGTVKACRRRTRLPPGFGQGVTRALPDTLRRLSVPVRSRHELDLTSHWTDSELRTTQAGVGDRIEPGPGLLRHGGKTKEET